jgi:phage-related protein
MTIEKILEWSGSSKRDLMDFPEDVRRAMGYTLGVAQLGAKHPSDKPWKGEGSGVFTQWHTHGQDRHRTGSPTAQSRPAT